jgi:hypothetical protein
MGAVLVGYPGQGREPRGSDVLEAIPISMGRIVASVSERHFVLADETQDAYTHAPKGGWAITNYGGISGSAVYITRRGAKSLDDFRLAGFVYEEGLGHTLLVAHADHINVDGSIR